MDDRSVKSWLRSPWLITIASLTVAYTLAFTLDRSLQQLRDYAGTTFNFRPAIFIWLIIPPLVIAGILALAWLALRILPPGRFAASAFLISGLFVLGEFLSIFVSFPVWLRSTIIGKFRYALMDFGAQSSIYYLASGCIVIGIAAFRRLAVTSRDPSPDM